MSLRDLIVRHASGPLTRVDHFGEAITYVPKTGAPVTFNAVVDRTGVEPLSPSARNISQLRFTVFVARHATRGILEHRPGDAIRCAPQIGAPVKDCRITRVVTEDEGGWLFEVTA